MEKRKCKYCNDEFDNKTKKTIFCSNNHRVYYFRKQKKLEKAIEYNKKMVEFIKATKNI